MQVDQIVVPVRTKVDDSDLNKLENNAKKSTNHLTQIFKNWADGIKKLFHNAFDFGSYFKKLGNKLSNLIDFDFLMTGIQKLKSAIGTVTSNIEKGFMAASGAFNKFMKNVPQKLKSVGMLIGRQLAKDLKQPLDEFLSWFKEHKTQINKSLTSIAQNIGHLLSSFAMGLIQIVKMGQTFFDWFNKLPQAIKGATYAVLAMWAVLKAGPIGVLATIVTLAGAIIDDYQKYKDYSGDKEKQNEKTALPGIWALFAGQEGSQSDKLTMAQKAKQIAGKLITSFLNGASDFIEQNKDKVLQIGTQIVQAIKGALLGTGDAAAGALDGQNKSAFERFGSTLGGLITDLVDFAIDSAGDIGGSIVTAVSSAFTGKTSSDWSEAFGAPAQENAFSQALGTYIETALLTGSPTTGLIAAIAVFLKKAFKKQDSKDQLLTPLQQQSDLTQQFIQFAQMVGQTFVGALQKVHIASSTVANAIATMLNNALSGWLTQSGTTKFTLNDGAKAGLENIIDGLIVGGITLIGSGGNLTAAIIGALVGVFGDAFTQAFNDSKLIDPNKGEIRFDWTTFVKKFLGGSQQTGHNVASLFSQIIRGALQGYKVISGAQKQLTTAIVGFVCNMFGVEMPQPSEAQKELIQGGINSLIVGALTGNVGTGLFAGIGTILLNAFTKAKDEALKGALKDKAFEDFTADDWSALLGFAGDDLLAIGQAFINIFIGAFNAVRNWLNTSEQAQKIKEEFLKIWNGTDQQQGLVTIFSNVWDSVRDGFVSMIKGLWQKVSGPVNNLADNIALTLYNALPQGLIKNLLWDAPRAVNTNGNGDITFSVGGKGDTTISMDSTQQAQQTAELLSKYKDVLDIENGQLVLNPSSNNQFGATGSETRKTMNEQLTQLLSLGNLEGLSNLLTYVSGVDKGELPADPARANRVGVAKNQINQVVQYGVEASSSKWTKEQTNNTGAIATNTQTTADKVSGIASAVAAANGYLSEITTNTAIKDSVGKSYGGRITSPARHLIGQDGTEYVIPINNTNRAVQLIYDMVTQMGGKAKDAVANALGLSGNVSTIGGAMMSGAGIGGAVGGGIVYNNVSAPVTINVSSSVANAESVGQQVYSSAQRALLRTLKAAVG